MRNLRKLLKLIIIVSLSVMFTACGGGGSDDEAEANADCVLGSSTIGNCNI